MNPSLSPLFAPQISNPIAQLQLALAQTWFQMGMPPPEVFFNFLQQAMANPQYGQQMSPFLSPFAGGGPSPGQGQTFVQVGMDGSVSAHGADKAEVLRSMTNLRDRLLSRHGADDPRVIGLNRAIKNLGGDQPVVRDHREAAVVRDHRDAPVVRDHRDAPVVRDHR